ncbi:MAG: DUF1848 domain-containing protein [Planctomycetota bacterium]
MGLIISASRRTDIPAFYNDWFMNRVRAGFCEVPNPFNPKQVARVSLRPEDVDAIVFWTKNPRPLLEHIAELERLGLRFYFQFSLHAYPALLEPRLPSVAARIAAFRQLSELLGAARVIWRYDPIIISNLTGYAFHKTAFAALCAQLSPCTRRVVISVVDYYGKTKRNLKPLEEQGFTFSTAAVDLPQTDDLLCGLAEVARAASLEIFSCAEPSAKAGPRWAGIRPGRCIDGELIERLWGLRRVWKKDPNQREECGCVVSKDIGAFDSCLHGCPYCYATRSLPLAEKRHAQHDAAAATLLGEN